MLSPQELGHMTDDIEKIWQELEDELLADIAQRIVKNDYTFPATAAWNKYKLEEIGVQYDYIVRQLSQTLRLSEKQVKRIIGESVQAAVDTDNLVFNAAAEAGLLESVTDTSELISKFIADGVKATNGELRNFARTYAAEASRAYEHAIDQAYLQVTNGFYTAQQASQTAIEQLARQGITSAITPSGRREHADVIVRRAVRTGTNQAALKAQEANFFAMEAQLVEVTAHYGARPSHAEWQGKIYEWTKPGQQKQTSYPDFVSATGYGTGAGLGGWNCRHSFYPFFEGLSERAYEPLNRRETERVYDLEQQQRYNERMIREWTRRQKMLEAGGCDASKEREKVKEWNRRNNTLIKANPDVLKKNYPNGKIILEPVSKLSSSAIIGTGSSRFEQIGKITVPLNSDLVTKVLKAYESQIINSDNEIAIIISQAGEVFKVLGDSNSVNINVLPDKVLYKSYMTHNHPKESTRFSFSNYDISEALRNKTQILRGVDYAYEYEMRISDLSKAGDLYEILHKFTTEYRLDVMQKAFELGLDFEEIEYDEINRILAKEYNYSYERWPR